MYDNGVNGEGEARHSFTNAQRLSLGHKNNTAAWVEEWAGTNTYRRSERTSEGVKVREPARAPKSDLLLV